MISGNSREPGGYTLLALVLLLTGVAMGGLMLIPSRLFPPMQDRRQQEEAMLSKLATGLSSAVRQELTIPDASTWSALVARATGFNRDKIECVYPEFRDDATTRRVFVVDPGAGAGVLPYVQTWNGLVGARTNLLGDNARVMMVSNTRRGLALPLAGGVPTSGAFDAVWDWAYDPATQAPPAGWPAAWNGKGGSLHVARIRMREFFANVNLTHLRYGVGSGMFSGGTLAATNLVLAPVICTLLKGTLLVVCQTNGAIHQVRVIRGDDGFNLAPTNRTVSAIAYLGFEEDPGAVVANLGTGGSSWNGVCVGGATLGATGPRPPGFGGFPADNRAVNLDGVGGYLGTRAKLPRGLGQFTMGGWIRPKSLRSSASFAFGAEKALSVEMSASQGKAEVTVRSQRSHKLTWRYPYALDSWHHVVVVGTGVALQLYVDGILVASRTQTVSEYSFDGGRYFTVGARAGKKSAASRDPFHGLLDEIVLYDRALSPVEVSRLFGGDVSLANEGDIPSQSWTVLADGFDVVAAK